MKCPFMFKLTLDQFENNLFLNGNRKSTITTFRSIFNKISAYFKNIEFNEENCDIFISELRSKIQSGTLRNYIIVLRHIGEITGDRFVFKYKTPKVDKKFIVTLTPQEIKQIAEVKTLRKKDKRKINYRYKCVIYALSLTGLRISELTCLKWEDIINDCFVIRKSKTGEARSVPLAPKVKELISKLPHYNHGFIFGSHLGGLNPSRFNLELKVRAKLMGIDKIITAHTFRHSFITECIQNDENPFKVKEIVGHKKLETTLAYTHLVVDDLINIVKSHPLAGMARLSLIKDKLRRFIERLNTGNLELLFEEKVDEVILRIRKRRLTN